MWGCCLFREHNNNEYHLQAGRQGTSSHRQLYLDDQDCISFEFRCTKGHVSGYPIEGTPVVVARGHLYIFISYIIYPPTYILIFIARVFKVGWGICFSLARSYSCVGFSTMETSWMGMLWSSRQEQPQFRFSQVPVGILL